MVTPVAVTLGGDVEAAGRAAVETGRWVEAGRSVTVADLPQYLLDPICHAGCVIGRSTRRRRVHDRFTLRATN
jgi:hypothetical protein